MNFIKYYTNNLPIIGENVIFIIKEINETGIYTYLPEYNDQISFLSFNNIPKKTRTNIKRNLKKNKEYVGEVNDIDNRSEIKILLSLHYILEKNIHEKKKNYNFKVKIINYLNYIFNKYHDTVYFKKPFVIILDEIVVNDYDNIYILIKNYIINYEEYFEKKFINFIIENINKKIENKVYHIKITFGIISSSYNGVDKLKEYFQNIINILENQKYNFMLISTPLYKLVIESNSKEEIELILNNLKLFLTKDIENIEINKLEIEKNY